MRLPDNSPAKLALEESFKSTNIERIGKRAFYKTWIGNTEFDINNIDRNLTTKYVYEHGIANERERWKKEIVQELSVRQVHRIGRGDE